MDCKYCLGKKVIQWPSGMSLEVGKQALDLWSIPEAVRILKLISLVASTFELGRMQRARCIWKRARRRIIKHWYYTTNGVLIDDDVIRLLIENAISDLKAWTGRRHMTSCVRARWQRHV